MEPELKHFDTCNFLLHFRIVSSAVGFKNKYLSVKSWQKWCVELVNRVKMKQSVKFKDTGDPGGESPAVEVMQYRDPKGHFAGKEIFCPMIPSRYVNM